MPPRPTLPPLPSPSAWPVHFPRRLLPISRTEPASVLRGRTLLASKQRCDEFVRELKIRPGELIIEANAGPGQLTRSLLEGGNTVDEDERWDAWESSREKGENDKAWPLWSRPSKGKGRADMSGEEKTNYPKPAAVLVAEPSLTLLERGLNYKSLSPRDGLKPGFGKPGYAGYAASTDPMGFSSFETLDHGGGFYQGVQQSPHHPNLLLSESSAYRWPTLPMLLQDPLVAPFVREGRRGWEDEPPNITVVATMPDSVSGEQLLAQWIGSSVGGIDGKQWLWRWGRVRLAILCGRGLYDRVMARPREAINCKVSVMASTLFHRRPLPPYHHVPNIDKAGRRLVAQPIPVGSPSKKAGPTMEAITDPSEGDWNHPPTKTLGRDFFPVVGLITSEIPIPRPSLLGIMLTPRLETLVLPEQKDAWDYVLRNCFIREIQPLSEATKNLGFGAEGLLEKFSDDKEGYGDRWRGIPVDPKTRVKDMTNEEWARVVDVFYKWAFKPETLVLGTEAGYEASREMGSD